MSHATDGADLERFRHYLLMLARLHLGRQLQGKLDASDIVQQTLLQAHRQRDQYRGQDEATRAAWLRKLLAGTLADALRTFGRAKRELGRERSLDAAIADSSLRIQAWLAAEQSSPSQQAARAEQAIRLAEALGQLPDAQREAVELRYCQGWCVAKIAAHMDKSVTAVAGLLKRGLKHLRDTLIEEL
ncbi:MAG: sigma-70 family RNA polymerase sigma factor [Planctomycetes bacterium]|nr:sigma-70 family RNA polymerase sigma factor [Planctomycetota bacterium]